MTRPSPPNIGNLPSTRPSLPNIGGNRPGGGGDRPTTLPPNLGNRPSTRPSLPNIGGNRPGGGGPTTRPSPPNIGNLPSTRPSLPNIGGNRPGGGGDRPTTLPGDLTRPSFPNIGGNRPGGGGDRPNLGDIIGGNRPGWPGGIQRPELPNRPGVDFRPGRPGRPGGIGDNNTIGSGNIGSGNIINRPNYGGNNYFGGDNYYFGGNNYYGGGGWFGGADGWGGANWGGNWGGGWGNAGWNNPYIVNHNNWYSGSWNNTNVNLNLGLGGWGLGGWGTGWGLGGWGSGFGYPASNGFVGVYDTFPTWGMGSYSGWGLGGVVTNWINTTYVNPYAVTTPVVVTAPAAAPGAAAPVVYDYSQPINIAAAPPEAAVTDDALTQFENARTAFKAGDYARALSLTDAALAELPNDPTLHEFRALTLFALRRYDEAATVNYAVLSAGPGWNWTTMAGLYADIDTYTNHLRSLEAAVRENPSSASDQFLLGYHYLVQGNNDAARARFEAVTKIQPNDTLSARFVKALTPPEQQPPATAPAPSATTAEPTALASAAPPAASDESEAESQPPAPIPPPANLAGNWTANPDPNVSITLTLNEDGAFTWKVTPKNGQPQEITGQADYRTGDEGSLLALLQAEGPPLAGKVVNPQDSQFEFQLLGGSNAPKLTFTR